MTIQTFNDYTINLLTIQSTYDNTDIKYYTIIQWQYRHKILYNNTMTIQSTYDNTDIKWQYWHLMTIQTLNVIQILNIIHILNIIQILNIIHLIKYYTFKLQIYF